MPFTPNFLIAAGMIILAIPFSMADIIIVALPLGLIGGLLLIKEMIG